MIAVNRKATFEYFIEDRYEAGLELQGWEVKSLRAGKCNISEAYVTVKDGEVIMLGSIINPLKMYWKGSWAKLEIGVARGKQDHDKRDSIKDKQWARDKERIMKKSFR